MPWCRICGAIFLDRYENRTTCPNCRRKREIILPQSVYKPTTESPIGTSLRGYLNTSYAKLVYLFGLPNGVVDCERTHFRWVLRDIHGEMVVIYDIDAIRTHVGEPLRPPKEQFKKLPLYRWHIGAMLTVPAARLALFIENAADPEPKVKVQKFKVEKKKRVRAIELEE